MLIASFLRRALSALIPLFLLTVRAQQRIPVASADTEEVRRNQILRLARQQEAGLRNLKYTNLVEALKKGQPPRPLVRPEDAAAQGMTKFVLSLVTLQNPNGHARPMVDARKERGQLVRVDRLKSLEDTWTKLSALLSRVF